MSERPAPCLVLICPPELHGTTCIIREAGQRQQWQLVRLDHHQLDYYDLTDLWPGWLAWEHVGRYLSTATLGFLNYAAFTTDHPLPPGF